jgi:hypothetical protein
VITVGIKEENIEFIQQWLLENPGTGALYLALLYIFAIPLTFPSMPLVFFGSFAASHLFGFYSKPFYYIHHFD